MRWSCGRTLELILGWLVCAPLLSSGCHSPTPANLPGGEVLRFGVSHFQGSYRFVVLQDGSAEYFASQPGQAEEIHLRARATREELAQVLRVLEENDFCDLRSRRKSGVPDEARPSIAVHSAGLDCRVQLWDGEYRDDAEARACLSAVESLGSTLRSRGK